MIDPFILIISLLIVSALFVLLTIVDVFILLLYPSILTMIFSGRFVWEVYSDGKMKAKKAKTIGGAYITDTGTFFFEKKDVLNCHGKQCIIVNASTDSKAIRPEIQPVLSLMKKLNVDSREKLDAILASPLISKDDYKKWISGGSNE